MSTVNTKLNGQSVAECLGCRMNNGEIYDVGLGIRKYTTYYMYAHEGKSEIQNHYYMTG